jgi:predicted membrane protein
LQRKSGYLWWWLTYQIFFIIVSAGIVVIFITIRDEKYGLLSYFKNYFFKILVTTFISIYFTFAALLIYFWLVVLSLHSQVKKDKSRSNGALVVDSSGNVTESSSEQNVASSSSSVQMIPLNLGGKELKDNGKIFIIRL